ncbi:hypothetical protein AB0D49_38035 [Streptomyces sp. NPDC048290]|uniref:hypothetical protein n=1 Tax=Streptomyces sp. NPDC048290 TaxID=3155811 RepID=UPI00344495B6
MSGIEAGGGQLHLHTVKDPGQTATLGLALPNGLPEEWADIEHRHRRWCADNGLRPLWTVPQLDGVESGHVNAYPSFEASRARRTAVGSGLLRRIALFHTATAFYRVQCWDDGDSWKIDARTARPRARWHDQLLHRLCHPRWGLPVRVGHRFCRCAEPDAPPPVGPHLRLLRRQQHRQRQRRPHPPARSCQRRRTRLRRAEIATLHQVGAVSDWMNRTFPEQAVQRHDQHQQRQGSAGLGTPGGHAAGCGRIDH